MQYQRSQRHRILFQTTTIAAFIAGAVIVNAAQFNYGENLSYEFGGKIVEQPTYRFLNDDSILNPDNSILDLSDWTNRFYGDINLNIYYRGMKFISKSRPTVLSEENETEVETYVDEAYLDITITDEFFFYIGRKNIRHGVGLSTNPTDFLGEGKEVDMTKREEDRRMERDGSYLIGVDAYYKNITVTAILAPHYFRQEEDKFLLKTDFFLEEINTDMSLHYFNAGIPGIGYNISTTIGDELVLYTEMAFRRGSERKTIKLISEGTPKTYQLYTADNSHKIYPHLVVGGHYTLKDGTNLIIEYIYNGDGNNEEEWNELAEFIKYSHDEYKRGFLTDLMKGNLLQANEIMNFREMRKNYFFARISNPEIKENIDGALAFFLNIDDGSFVINPSFDYKIEDSISLGFFSRVFIGKESSEFGMLYWNSDTGIVLNYFF